MTDTKVDRRVGRTRRLLKEALLALIRERGYERVSIRDITERADVGRSTFYSHFSSKEDLLFDGFDRWLMSRAEPADGEASGARARFNFSLPFLAHIGHQPRFFQAFLGSAAGARVRRKTLEIVTGIIRHELDRMSPESSPQAPGGEARVQFLVGGFVGLTSWWIDDACRLPAEEVDRIFQEMALRGAAGAA